MTSKKTTKATAAEAKREETTAPKTIPTIPEMPATPKMPEVRVESPRVKRYNHDDGDITWAILLIVGGIILLLNNVGLLPWSVWGTLWRFWPVLLVLWGVQLIVGKSWIGKIITFIITLGALCIVAGFAVLIHDTELRNRVNQQFPSLQLGKLESFKTEKEIINEQILRSEFSNIERHKVSMTFNEGRYRVTDNLGGEWITIGGAVQKPRVDFSLHAEEKDSTLTTNVALKTKNFFLIAPEESDLSINLPTPEIATDLSVSMTSGNGVMELQDLNLKRLSFDMTSGHADIRLSDKAIPQESFVIDMTAGNVTLYVPASVGIRVNHDITSGSLEIGEIKVMRDGTFMSDNFDTAEKKLEIRADMTSGKIQIIRE
ncbi:MAG: LiaF-related protein [Candidatus Dojkabacteria bacterium]|nr:MAG: LiaF-related protein [Candidatus Dojkabacteria bacterium]